MRFIVVSTFTEPFDEEELYHVLLDHLEIHLEVNTRKGFYIHSITPMSEYIGVTIMESNDFTLEELSSAIKKYVDNDTFSSIVKIEKVLD